ncbi:MAG TPA: hypothetical protein V6C72_08785, partial [Chroococcales cyanobacterium]
DHAKAPYIVHTGHHLLTPETLMQVAQQNADVQKVLVAAMAKATTAYLKDHPQPTTTNNPPVYYA